MVSDLCDCITGVLFCWDRDYRRQNKFGGKCCLSFRQVEFSFQWEVKVFIFSRQLDIQVWSSKGDHGVKNGFESHPSNAILEIQGEGILSFCLQSSFLPERIQFMRVGQRKNMRSWEGDDRYSEGGPLMCGVRTAKGRRSGSVKLTQVEVPFYFYIWSLSFVFFFLNSFHSLIAF